MTSSLLTQSGARNLLPLQASDTSLGRVFVPPKDGYLVKKQQDKHNFQHVRYRTEYSNYNLTVMCHNRKCGTCRFIDKNSFITSTVNKKVFYSEINQGSTFNCNSKNVIYLINCQTCGLQYVGQTRRTLKERFGRHKANLRDDKEKNFLYTHYRTEGHNLFSMKIKILQQCNHTEELNAAEDFWIKTLQTIYPLGLNDNVYKLGNISNRANYKDTRFFEYLFHKLPRKIRGNGRRRRNSKLVNYDFISFAKNCNFDDSRNRIKFAQELFKQSKKTIIEALSIIDKNDPHFEYKMSLLHGYLDKKFIKKHNDTITRNKEYFVTAYPGKAFHELNFSRFFNCKNSVALLPTECNKFKTVTTFTYDIPLGPKVFNYNKILKKLSNTQELHTSLMNNCDCYLSKFNYLSVNHVVTCNPDVYLNQAYSSFFVKGTKFRPIINKTKNKIFEIWTEDINKFINRIAKKYNIEIQKFARWKVYMLEYFYKVLIHVALDQNFLTDLNYKKFLDNFRSLENKYIVCPVDKAGNNFAFVC